MKASGKVAIIVTASSMEVPDDLLINGFNEKYKKLFVNVQRSLKVTITTIGMWKTEQPGHIAQFHNPNTVGETLKVVSLSLNYKER